PWRGRRGSWAPRPRRCRAPGRRSPAGRARTSGGRSSTARALPHVGGAGANVRGRAGGSQGHRPASRFPPPSGRDTVVAGDNPSEVFTMRSLWVGCFAVAVGLAFAGSSAADRPPQDRDKATHVVVGRVVRLFAEVGVKTANLGYLEVKVEKSERGGGLKAGD